MRQLVVEVYFFFVYAFQKAGFNAIGSLPWEGAYTLLSNIKIIEVFDVRYKKHDEMDGPELTTMIG
ncbi:hypothetical protein [Mycoavidus sp. SF9855]|uniref:hypothetical protein n=1 Tax=Mycoavidus sp. SF9855 TaxID=2968475 RepID=UPI00211BEA1F|nr:hypothetical protein [Mycoavidus sp. SF9855]UUM21975.1 hypothetical protein NQD60_02430 [Mycoavidus sp. SF9855]